MSSTFEPAIRSCDTGQQNHFQVYKRTTEMVRIYKNLHDRNGHFRISCFDSCQLTMKWFSHIKLKRCKLHVDLYIFFGRYFARLRLCRLINILRNYICVRDMVMWHGSAVSWFDSCQLTWISNVIKLMWTLMWPYVYQAFIAEVAMFARRCRRRRRRQYAPASYTGSHVDHEKRNEWVS